MKFDLCPISEKVVVVVEAIVGRSMEKALRQVLYRIIIVTVITPSDVKGHAYALILTSSSSSYSFVPAVC